MKIEDALNNFIKESEVETNLISDGYHTFGELYEHRITLFIALINTLQKYHDNQVVWKSKKHSDGTAVEGWFVAGIFSKQGDQITYHLPMDKWILLDIPEFNTAPEWDGHKPEDVLERLLKL